MDSFKKLINENSIYFEKMEYYFAIAQEAEVNLRDNPDISIESCKSLIEGVSKYILSVLLAENYNDNTISRKKFKAIVNTMLKEVAKRRGAIDDNHFISQCLEFVGILGKTRNDRGDICHGRCSPKEEVSSPELAKLVFSMTDAVLSYILDIFFQIEDPRIKEEESYDHESLRDFNDYLDEENPLDDGISYSKAIFYQDPIAYKVKYDNFLDNQEANQ